TYSTTAPTANPVVATLTGASESITITNNGGSTTYTFTSNGSFTFLYQDVAGNTGSTQANVTWIDNTGPIVTSKSTSNLSVNGVTINFNFSEGNFSPSGTGSVIVYTGSNLFAPVETGSTNISFSSGIGAGTSIFTNLTGSTTYIYLIKLTDSLGNFSNSSGTFSTLSNNSDSSTGGTTYSGGSGGGGIGGFKVGGFIKDNCPNGDYSSSYYDNLCGVGTNSGSINNDTFKNTYLYLKSYFKSQSTLIILEKLSKIINSNIEISKIEKYANFDYSIKSKYNLFLNYYSNFLLSIDKYIVSKDRNDYLDAKKNLELLQQLFIELKNIDSKYVSIINYKNNLVIYNPKDEKLLITFNKIENIILNRLNNLLSIGKITETEYNKAIGYYNDFVLEFSIYKKMTLLDAKNNAIIALKNLLNVLK
nr:hypothetical protein [Candidatus Gracilibacteria bacterium]